MTGQPTTSGKRGSPSRGPPTTSPSGSNGGDVVLQVIESSDLNHEWGFIGNT